ncbi:hypothetical protein LWI29_027954 [Acer saccharum]|uniref:Cytochrome b5 heme-binding domain-containing protein n=1 Tax=Acer saccharum TaxID=4024 RepID=A0AA39W0L0_ACESA|nr:hypothetical protein LWI29_027954 [Acer saccharum]
MEETSSKTLALVCGPGSKPICKTQPESFSEDNASLKKGLPEIDKLAESMEDPVGNVLLTTAAQVSELATSNTILTQPVPTDMVISPKKKINRKWKRSARESSSQQIQGGISSPLKKAQILGKIVKKMARDKATSSPVKEAITAYTGLSPATFFTVLALLWAVYYVLSGVFVSRDAIFGSASDMHHVQRSSEQIEPLQPPVQLGEITEEDLKQYDGSDSKKPLLMAIKGQIYDVSQSRMFYGPGGPYALFAGKDASRALAKMSFEDKDLTGDTSGLGPFELEALQDWEYKFMSKYVKVGSIKKEEVPVADGESAAEKNEEDVAKPVEDGPSESAAVQSEETPSGVDAAKE